MTEKVTLVLDAEFAMRLLRLYVHRADPLQFFDKANEDLMESQLRKEIESIERRKKEEVLKSETIDGTVHK